MNRRAKQSAALLRARPAGARSFLSGAALEQHDAPGAVGRALERGVYGRELVVAVEQFWFRFAP